MLKRTNKRGLEVLAVALSERLSEFIVNIQIDFLQMLSLDIFGFIKIDETIEIYNFSTFFLNNQIILTIYFKKNETF